MNILIANDDGYKAKGINVLAQRLAREHNVTIVAPDGERSGASHTLSFFGGITYERIGNVNGVETYSVHGTPADCVIFGLKYILKDTKVDVVLSGINNVLNVGSDIIYSGTFGAAQEGTFQQIPSIAVSLREHGSGEYGFAADFIAENLETLMSFADGNVTVNVNIPRFMREDNKGVRVAPVTYRPYVEEYYKQADSLGNDVFYINGHPIRQTEENCDGDCYLCEHDYITVTPVRLISNDFGLIERMKKADFVL